MSKLFELGKQDFIKGLVVAILTAVLTLIVRIIESKGLALDPVDLQSIISTAIIAGLGYLLKNLGTDENGKIGGVL